MADDRGDKTEAPTPRRRQQAEEQGQIARSQDLVAAALVVGALVLLDKFGPGLLGLLRSMIVSSFESLSAVDQQSPGEILAASIVAAAKALAPVLLGLMVIALAGNFIQVGFRWTPKKLQPKLGALNPLKGFGRLFSSSNPMRFAMSVAKLVVIGFVGWSAVQGRLPEIIGALRLQEAPLLAFIAGILYSVAMKIGVALLILALLDFAWQKWKHERDLKMTKQEVKDDMRNMEGDPRLKMRRRQIALQMASKRLKKDVPTADVVVTNPTEYAVALKYDATGMHAPKVIAKGQGPIALRIRQIAIEAGVPILERKPLARALYKLVAVGQEIPEQFYSAVAEILAYVYELTGKAKRRVAV